MHERRYRRQMANLIERYRDRIERVLSRFDRVLIQGTLPGVCYAKPMSITLDSRGVKLFDYATAVPGGDPRAHRTCGGRCRD